MPNGHGGYPWMGGPVLLLVALLVVIFLPMDPQSSHETARELLALVLAGLLGCRVAYHLHLRRLDAYMGAYTDPDAYRRGRMRFRIACVLYAVIAIYLAHLALERSS